MKKIFKSIIHTLLVTAFAANANAQQVPAPPQGKAIVITGATVHVGNGDVIENGAVAFDEGKITFVGATNKAPQEGAQVIDAKGKHVYPGLIAPFTRLGLVEIGAVRATQDYREAGVFNPSLRSIIAYNTDSRVTPTVRSNGILMAQIVPSGGWVSGQSSVVELDGWNWEDAAYKIDNGIVMSFPAPYQRLGWWAAPGGVKANKDYEKQIKAIKDFLKDAKSYAEGKPKVTNLKFEAMRGVFDGSKRLYISTNYVKAMMSAVEMCKDLGIQEYVLVGAADAWQITDYLKKNEVKIMLARTQRLPNRRHEDVDQPFKTPKALEDAGITYCLMFDDYWKVRDLPFQGGQAVAFGLGKEDALKSMTLNAARVLGIDATVGSLEVGKDATLIISEGDVMDQLTNQVTDAFIRGKAIDLDNKQKALYRKFKAKYGE